MVTDYVEDYEEVTGLPREVVVETKIVRPPSKASTSTVVVK